MSNASFTKTALAGDRYLVEGTDRRGTSGSTVVNGETWNRLQRERAVRAAHEQFDRKVEKFYADLIEAVDQLDAAHKVTVDPLLYIVEQEGTPSQAGQPEKILALDPDTVILRAIDEGHVDRLLWVNGHLEVTALSTDEPVVEPVVEPDDEPGDERIDYVLNDGAVEG